MPEIKFPDSKKHIRLRKYNKENYDAIGTSIKYYKRMTKTPREELAHLDGDVDKIYMYLRHKSSEQRKEKREAARKAKEEEDVKEVGYGSENVKVEEAKEEPKQVLKRKPRVKKIKDDTAVVLPQP
jgi:hypothetical protein